MTYEEAIEKIHSFQVFGSRLGLERMKERLRLLGDPHRDLKIIHAAGTNGKGSVCRYVYSALQENGYRCGAYFSPYIENFTERIEFDGKEISREALAHHTELCLKAADRMMSEGFESPTEFELVTAVGLSYFAEEKADFVILEVGLGGKGDSTNICDKPIVTAITSIAFDHMAQLGNTLELIAADKAGILKADVPAVVCVPDAGPMEVIRARAKELRAPLIDVTKFRVENIREDLGGSRFDAVLEGFSELRSFFADAEKNPAGGSARFGDRAFPRQNGGKRQASDPQFKNIEISMHGRHQISNALCALSMIEVMRETGILMTEEKIRRGMKKAVQKARFEIVEKSPYVILDGAHNPAGAKALTETVLTHFSGKRILLCAGILKDKACREMAELLTALRADLILTNVPNPRTMEAGELADIFLSFDLYGKRERETAVIPDWAEAVARAEERKGDYDLVLWAGSLYLMGEVRRRITCRK